MENNIKEFIDLILDLADCMDDLADAVREQREALKNNTGGAEFINNLNDLMDETREIFFEAQTLETQRDDFAKKLAAKLNCEPRASSLSALMNDSDRTAFNTAADRLTQSVFVLKSEMLILNGLIEHNEKYSAMLISEWRRLIGENSRTAAQTDLNFTG